VSKVPLFRKKACTAFLFIILSFFSLLQILNFTNLFYFLMISFKRKAPFQSDTYNVTVVLYLNLRDLLCRKIPNHAVLSHRT